MSKYVQWKKKHAQGVSKSYCINDLAVPWIPLSNLDLINYQYNWKLTISHYPYTSRLIDLSYVCIHFTNCFLGYWISALEFEDKINKKCGNIDTWYMI